MEAFIKENGRTFKLPISIQVAYNEEAKEDVFYISFPFNRTLINEIKTSLEKIKWEKPFWIAKITKRNENCLALLTRSSDPLEIYYQEPKSSMLIDYSGLWEHQKKMVNHLLTKKRCIIAGEMRTGKTLPTLRAIIALNKKQQMETWWVAPKSALAGLELELKKWNIKSDIKLVTYDKFRKLGQLGFAPDILVLDECHKVKNPEAQVTRSAFEVAGQVTHLFLLSGTPAPKNPSDWWSLTELCCPGFLKEASKSLLKRSLGEFEEREGISGFYWHILSWKKDEVERLHKRLKPIVEVFLKKDCLDLPPKVYTEVVLYVTPEYSEAAAFVKNTTAKPIEILNRLRQLSDGFLYSKEYKDTKEKRTTKYLPNNPKDSQLLSDLKELEDKTDNPRLVIYCGYQATLDKLTHLIPKDWAILKIDGRSWDVLNSEYNKNFLLSEMDASTNSNTIEKLVVLAQADAASTGLELSAAEKVIYYSNSFNGAARMQSEDRAYSKNNGNIEIVDYIHLPTDKLVKDNLLTKKTLQAVTFGEIVDSLEGIL